uniref:Uncharacterized protein n=1 Tax=Romanomermis culicivorax TaxID=13658 RepID=A0A915KWP9_ROMCU
MEPEISASLTSEFRISITNRQHVCLLDLQGRNQEFSEYRKSLPKETNEKTKGVRQCEHTLPFSFNIALEVEHL